MCIYMHTFQKHKIGEMCVCIYAHISENKTGKVCLLLFYFLKCGYIDTHLSIFLKYIYMYIYIHIHAAGKLISGGKLIYLSWNEVTYAHPNQHNM